MWFRLIGTGFAAAFGVLVAGFGNGAEGACDPFPEVDWWGDLSHESVVEYVDRKHRGN
ncbi:MAG: hypothetical protein QGG17_10120 [Rhodospirillales bacterium]|jgi:hypothetical protein|nr:hypothetical protein [Rhodospirillales bacterium]MDP6805680.1 hypothetical protein [Rhodospirillales bacterium]